MHFRSERLIAFKKAYEIFRRELYRDDGHGSSTPILSGLHEAFGALGTTSHNCLGCNFSNLTDSFDQVLSGLDEYSDINAPCFTYIIWLYLYVERYDQIMSYLQVPERYRQRHFRSFQRIRRWSNFIKHPKSFLFSHHAQYFHGGEIGDEGFVIKDDTVQINSDFVNAYYAGGKNNNKLAAMLNNATEVLVVYPDPEALMENFATETKAFVRLIEMNEVYREELTRITTMPDYFQKVHPDDDNE